MEAEIEKGLLQHPLGAEIERDQKAADAPVAVEERMDRLELDVEQPRLDERRQSRLVFVDEGFEGGEASGEFVTKFAV